VPGAEALTQPAAVVDEGDAPGVNRAHPVHVYVHVVLVALLGAVAVLVWLVVFETLTKLLWENDLVTANPWLAPAICLPFSLAVGLLVKYRNAPTNLDESLLDTLSGDLGKVMWRRLPVNILQAWASLLSGAVLGPEGAIGGISSKLAMLYAEKMGIAAEERPRLVFATIGSAYNGLVASPLFAGVLATEIEPDPATRGRTLPANLIGGAIGFLVFEMAGTTGLQDYLHLAGGATLRPVDMGLVVVFGLLGMVMAILTGLLFRVAASVFGRLEGREVERALIAGVIFSAVGIFAPILLFSGETQILEVLADPAAYGPGILLAMAAAKLALLAVAFKSGFLGGPVFPSIFASVCVALAIDAIFPGIPIEVLIGGIMAGFLMVLFKAPFMVILLTVVMLQADPNLTALIVLAVAAVMVAQPYVVAAIAARGTGTAAGAAAGARPGR